MLIWTQRILSIPVWLLALLAQAPFYVAGWVVVPFTRAWLYDDSRNPPMPASWREGQPEWWRDYVWRAWRNPLPGLRWWVNEPEEDSYYDDWYGENNPDWLVRDGYEIHSFWYIRRGLFFEYWYLRRVGNKYFEFRIGWKYGIEPGFAPSFSLRLGG